MSCIFVSGFYIVFFILSCIAMHCKALWCNLGCLNVQLQVHLLDLPLLAEFFLLLLFGLVLLLLLLHGLTVLLKQQQGDNNKQPSQQHLKAT